MCSARVFGLCDDRDQIIVTPLDKNKEPIHRPGRYLPCQPPGDKEMKWKRMIGKDRDAIIVVPIDTLLRYSPDWFRNAVQPFNVVSVEAYRWNGCFWYSILF